jgi:hypothetical protein
VSLLSIWHLIFAFLQVIHATDARWRVLLILNGGLAVLDSRLCQNEKSCLRTLYVLGQISVVGHSSGKIQPVVVMKEE